MAALTRDDPKVRLSRDNTKAYVFLPEPGFEGYSVDEVIGILQSNGISYGIKDDTVKNIVEGQLYNQEVLVAEADKLGFTLPHTG